MISFPRVQQRLVPALAMMAIALTIGLAGACASSEPADTRVQDETAIRAVQTAWSAALKAKDADKFLANYAADAVVLPPNAPIASSPEAIRKGLTDLMAMPGLSMTFRPTAVTVAKAGDVAYTYGTYEMSMTGPDGKPAHDNGKYATVYKKQTDGSWKAVVDMFNSDQPPAPPPPPTKHPATKHPTKKK